jgi:hypothetical protein
MNVKELSKGDVFWEWDAGGSTPFVVISTPEPLCADDGDVLGWRLAAYNVVTQKIVEQYQGVSAASFLHENPLMMPTLAPLFAAFGAAMIDYANVAVNADLAAAFANHNEAMQRKQQEYEVLREGAKAQIIGTHQYYQEILKQIVLNADAQCHAIQRILAREESGK